MLIDIPKTYIETDTLNYLTYSGQTLKIYKGNSEEYAKELVMEFKKAEKRMFKSQTNELNT